MGSTDISVLDGLLTNAAEFRGGLVGFNPGVLGDADLKVQQRGAGANGSVDVLKGRAILRSPVTSQPQYHCPNYLVSQESDGNSSNSTFFPLGNFAAPHASFARLDQIIARLYDNESGQRKWQLEVLTGLTPTTNATLANRHNAAPLPTGVPVIPLADIVMPVSGVVTTALIGDTRPWAHRGLIRSFGKCIIPASEQRVNVNYGLMPTPDRVQGIVLPTDGLIAIGYKARWSETVSGAAKAALFLNANQLMVDSGTASPVVQEAASSGIIIASLFTTAIGLTGGANFSNYTGDVTTGQSLSGVVSGPSTDGGICYVFAAAGTYDVSVQFKASSGNASADFRKLWVWSMGF